MADGVALDQELLEPDGQGVAEPQDQHQHDHPAQARQRDVPHPPEPPRAVCGRGLVQLAVDRAQRREEDDDPPARLLPDRLRGDQQGEGVRVGHDVPGADVVLAQELVEHAGAAQHLLEDRDRQHPGEEVRQVDHGLEEVADPLADHRVEQQGQGDRDREEQDQLDEAEVQRVLHRGPERRVAEQLLELLEPDPFAVPDPDQRVVLLEGGDDAEQRRVVEHQEQDDRGHRHQQEGLVAPQPGPPAEPRGAGRVLRGRRAHWPVPYLLRTLSVIHCLSRSPGPERQLAMASCNSETFFLPW